MKLKRNNILITGYVSFISFHIAEIFLKKKYSCSESLSLFKIYNENKK